VSGNFAAVVDIITAGQYLEQAIHPSVTPTADDMAAAIGRAAVQVQNAASYWSQEGDQERAQRATAVANQLAAWTANPPDRQTLYLYQNSSMDDIYRDAEASAAGIPSWGWWSIGLGVAGILGIVIGVYDLVVTRR
jgi:hypothetical protein